MSEPKFAPYRSWKSPITLDLIILEFVGRGHGFALSSMTAPV